jgi:hypothetical protein
LTQDSQGENYYYKLAYETVTDDSFANTDYSSAATRNLGESIRFSRKNTVQKKAMQEMSIGDIIPEADTPFERSQITNFDSPKPSEVKTEAQPDHGLDYVESKTSSLNSLRQPSVASKAGSVVSNYSSNAEIKTDNYYQSLLSKLTGGIDYSQQPVDMSGAGT